MKIYSGERYRKLTPKEYFRLMGFTDADVELLEINGISKTQLYKMAGNSIPVKMLEHLFKQVYLSVLNCQNRPENFVSSYKNKIDMEPEIVQNHNKNDQNFAIKDGFYRTDISGTPCTVPNKSSNEYKIKEKSIPQVSPITSITKAPITNIITDDWQTRRQEKVAADTLRKDIPEVYP